MKMYDLTGRKFGRLTATKKILKTFKCGSKKYLWICSCDCGGTATVSTSDLLNGHTQSCGCYQRERTSICSKKHGMRHTRIYHVWQDMKNRCMNPRTKEYKNYGGRGIQVCEEWNGEDGFVNFYDYVSKLNHFGEEGYTLDRIDNEGNYEPQNVRWATIREQSNNRRVTVFVDVYGLKLSIADLSEITGTKHNTLYMRYRQGRPIIYENEKEILLHGIKDRELSASKQN